MALMHSNRHRYGTSWTHICPQQIAFHQMPFSGNSGSNHLMTIGRSQVTRDAGLPFISALGLGAMSCCKCSRIFVFGRRSRLSLSSFCLTNHMQPENLKVSITLEIGGGVRIMISSCSAAVSRCRGTEHRAIGY